MVQYLGLHETLDVHELLTIKNISLTKSTLMSGLVADEELKAILANEAALGQKHIKQLQELITNREAQ
ncbi:hypothetical protein [Bacillus sp. PS06]|uniref:hypothetical protein n=1 Tax=Bacillus sp. PS06 TaxID=2764176 RepID=UPI00177EBB87|nr:hypothetical protein [Bacillus sp. PS06]MBD8068699.1 hypothetical protein [Bacillus sp. PS06]